jgi:hypothetical protein
VNRISQCIENYSLILLKEFPDFFGTSFDYLVEVPSRTELFQGILDGSVAAFRGEQG